MKHIYIYDNKKILYIYISINIRQHVESTFFFNEKQQSPQRVSLIFISPLKRGWLYDSGFAQQNPAKGIA